MDTKDDPVSMEDTGAASHSEDVNNSKNNDNVESCSSKETEGIKQSQINENTAEVHDKSNEEENPGTCEKDSAVSNIETSDSTLDLETSKKNDNTEIETTLPENNSENVGTKESNAVENKEAEMALADTEVAELDIPNLTKNTDVLALEDLCKVPADAVNDDEKFINDNIITEESETSKEKTDDCDIPNKTIISDNVITESEISSKDTTKDIADESSTNKNVVTESEKPCTEGTKESNIPDENSSSVDDIQLLQKEDVLLNKTDGTNKKIESESSDSNLDNSEKDLPEKKSENTEPETTEFVQISHDKNDDSQIEVQSMDAEDPFGGDNLTSESIEQPETDNFVDSELSFKKLYEQDNLQNEIITEGNDCRNEKSNVDSATNDPKDIDIDKAVDNIAEASSNVQTVESLEVISIDTDLPGTSISETGTENILFPKSTNEQNVQGKKNIEQITTMETDEADVLPGQDDELCIIPDSMKVIMPSKSGKATDDNQIETELLKNFECTEITEKCSKSNLEREDTSNTSRLVTDNTNKDDSIVQQDVIIQDVSKLTTVSSILASDIINIDDGTKHSKVKQIVNKEACKQCGEVGAIRIRVRIGTQSYFVCSKTCKALFKAANIMSKILDIPSQGINTKQEKRCATCLSIIELNDERNLSWETMEFCNEECLGKFQRRYGSYCKNCSGTVQAVSLGKYCVRFGCDVRQFCCSTCLEEFKKGLKVCSYCQKDISVSAEGFLAPVGEKGQFKDFCTQDCMEKYSKLNSTEPLPTEKKLCSVCKEEKPVHREVQIYNSTPVAICSEPCFAAFKFVKQVKPEQCSTCKKFFELPNKQHFVVFYENEPHTFCNKTCLNIFIITNRKILPCNWCKVKKYNFDMIKKELKTGQVLMMCSLNCLTLYQVSINAVSAKRINCDLCKEYSLAHYHLTMSDATIRNFCSYNCVMNFQAQYTKSPITIPPSDDPVPAGLPKKTTLPQKSINQIVPNEVQKKKIMPVISSVTSLASMGNGQANQTPQQNNVVIPANANQTAPMVYKQQVITRPPSPAKMHNKMTQCKPLVHTKGVSVRPHPCTKGTQTTENVQQVLVPVPVPIYVPFPMHMYSMPFPVPMPFPLPIPVPLFIPTTRNSAKGIMKDIKKIQEKIPADPYEAELLMMAEMVATEKKVNDSDSDSVDDKEDDTADQDNLHSDGFSPEAVDSSNTFGDDMLQMALKMATGELDEPAVDLEAALTPNTITATQAPSQPENALDNDVQSERLMVGSRGRKRVMPYKPRTTATKRMRRVSGTNDMPLMPPPESQPPPQPRIMEPMEKPDANMALKYTFGVNAWRQWVVGKNAELEKQFTPMKKIKLFKTDLLQLTADELNYSLCLFVKEVRKPNGSEYAPDTIYYLCLGIQQYLFENNRIDNIFTDSYYEKFTDCLNEVAKKFSMLYNDAQYIVTRVEEEHLWECKQLGAHSPHVLLSTLMFFNTKHFNLVTVEEHMQLSFSHIMKHWKRNPAAQPAAVAGKVPGSRNVLLRFYPPQSALEANSRKKKVYEQQENEENPLRCPVKLYEFYLSKCPESVKTRNDVFYLLPERSCVPDSPVWYSTSPLAKEQLVKMLYRIKMVKEINVALLTS